MAVRERLNKNSLKQASIEYFAMQSFICCKVVCILLVGTMTKEPDLREIERKAYMSYHQDGLLDIFVGVYILGFGLGIWADITLEFGFGLIMPAILIATYCRYGLQQKEKSLCPALAL